MTGAPIAKLRAQSKAWLAASFVCGGLAAFAALGIGGLLVVQTGAFDVRASTPHSLLVGWATHTTMIHAARNGAARVGPSPPITTAAVEAGFRDYDANCAACHGGPAVPRAPWTGGMTPSPPFLIDASRQWRRAELFWIIRNGVKMTGMPSWGFTRSDPQVWNLVAFLEALPYISPEAYGRMRAAQGTMLRRPCCSPAGSPSP